MALSPLDRNLLEQCLARRPRSWENFVDRFLGLVIHVVHHTAQTRLIRLSPQDVEDLVADVFVEILANDLALLRRFRGQSSLATYLTVVARRVVVRELLSRKSSTSLSDTAELAAEERYPPVEDRISDRDEVERLLGQLSGDERDIMRLYHLEGKSYREISTQTGVPENSVGPALSRARAKLRRLGVDSAAG